MEGQAEQVVRSKKNTPQPHWHQPAQGVDKGLQVLNSLKLDTKANVLVPFLPQTGNLIKWYICGPTVYDSAHFGHARNYVTFDVIRRILEDYFNYDVYAVMNITDVDDKIILRARKNHLLKLYEEEHANLTTQVLDDIAEGFDDYRQDLGKKIQELEAEIAQLVARKKKNKTVEKEAEKKLLADKLASVPKSEAALATLRERVVAGDQVPSTQAFVEVASVRDVVADLLDKRHGHSITDERIFRAHAARYEEEFLEDMKELGVRVPDVMTRVTEYIPEIVQYVQKIQANGVAYEANGSVYFNTEAFAKQGHAYGKLEPWSVGDGKLLKSGEGALSDKRDKKVSENDFALWKQSKPGEPSWDSPWGRGRPGWHIECSAMASDLFGYNMDIHSGGSDLRFPHHDNELAQAEAHYGCKQWVNYFLHSGHLHIDGLKMSKSLKNFITIREALEACSPRQMRLYFVGTAWWSVMDFDRKDGMTEIKNKEKTLLRFFENVHQIYLDEQGTGKVGSSAQKWSDDEKELYAKFLKAQEVVHTSFCNNFDTPEVLQQVFGVVHAANAYINLHKGKEHPPKALLLNKLASYVAHILGVMGIEFPEHGYGSSAESSSSTGSKEVLDVLAAFRKDVRTAAKEKKPHSEFLLMTDRLRDDVMPDLGVRLEDDGLNSWTAVAPEVLKKEIADKRHNAVKAVVDKKLKRRVLLVRDVKNYEDASRPPTDLFKDGYSQFDAQGLPTHDAEGKELSKSAKSKLTKEFQKRQKDHAKYLDLLQKDPEFLVKMRQELSEIDAFLAQHSTV